MYSIVTAIPQSTGDIPNYDLTTVEAVNAELGLTSNSSNDAAVALQITAASKAIASICDRVFARQTVSELFRPQWDDNISALPLSRYPVTGDIIVMVNDAVIDPASYELEPDNGMLRRINGQWGWGRHVNGYWGFAGHRKVTVDYTGGYDLPNEAPAMLSMACLLLIKDRRLNAKRDLLVNEVWAGENRVRYFQPKYGLPPDIVEMLAPFKRLAV